MLELTVCLDPGDGRPLYQQLYESLIQQIRDGRLRRGDRLPGKRSLAGQLACLEKRLPSPPPPQLRGLGYRPFEGGLIKALISS